MAELLKEPVILLAGGGLLWTLAGIPVAYLLGVLVWSKYPVEEEPVLDLEALEAELQMEAAVLEYRLSNERRLALLAGVQ
jgi:hypothetical protein